MQKPEWPEDYDHETARSRSSSRRNSASLSRRSSIQKDKEGKKKSPLNTAPSSTNSTPKKQVKQNLDFCVTGKQLLKKSDRANSLPGSHRRPSLEAAKRRPSEAPKRPAPADSRDASLEDDALDLSQVSDFEDTSSKYGLQKKLSALATSTPKTSPRNPQKTRSTSLQSQLHLQKVESSRRPKPESRQSNSTVSCSRDSLYKNSTFNSNYRYVGTELDYSSVSPECSQSSTELSPRNARELTVSPRSQEMQLSSSCVSTWQDASDTENTKVEDYRDHGEWSHFWANYNNSVAKVPMKNYYDQCPTPYRTENIDLADLDFSTEGSRMRSPDNFQNLNNIIRTEGLHLTPRETQNIIKCAHILGNVLSKAIERRSKEKDIDAEIVQEVTSDPKEEKKKNMTLDLKETVVPLEVKEVMKSETTQTDISLPNTKSAPKIFEKILRQLSKTSLEEKIENKEVEKEKVEENSVIKEEVEDQTETSTAEQGPPP